MSENRKTYEEVASRCSKFQSIYNTDVFQSMYSDGPCESCVNCHNFTNEKYCNLDLFDQIVNNHRL